MFIESTELKMLSVGKGSIFYEDGVPTGVIYTAASVQDILIKSVMFPDISQIRAWKTPVITPFAIDATQWIIHPVAQTCMLLKAIITDTRTFVNISLSPEEARQFNSYYCWKTGNVRCWYASQKTEVLWSTQPTVVVMANSCRHCQQLLPSAAT
jgi:hypothetical protein